MAKKRVSKWSKEELEKLRQSLPSGWKESLSIKHKLAESTVENILYGNHVNDDVVLSAIAQAADYKKLIESQKAIIQSL